MSQMDYSVKAYLNSPEGQQWLIDNEDVLKVFSNYIFDPEYPMGRLEIEIVLKMFPEFKYKGPGFRALMQDSINSNKLVWRDDLDSFAWSKSKHAYRSVISSLTKKNQLVQIYQGNVTGLDLHAFILEFSEFYLPFKNSLGLTAHEEEVLALSFTNLEKIEEFIHE